MSPLADKPSGCVGCDAYEWGQGFVPPESRSSPKLAFLGQGPGETEAYTSRPFHPKAPAGSRLTKWIHRSSLQRSECWVGNLVQCWLPAKRERGRPAGNRDPKLAEAKWCWNAHVGPALHKLNPAYLVTVGSPATRFILGIPQDKGAERYAGTMNNTELPEVGVNSAE